MSTFVHDTALCESDEVGDGTRIWAFAHVMAGAKVGRNCNVGDYVFIEDGVEVGDGVTIKNGVQLYRGVHLEDRVFVGPNVVFTNDLRPRASLRKAPEELLSTRVRAGASLGANATILCGLEVGTNAFVAAGAVVTRSVPDHALVVGVPAAWRAWVCECGGELDAKRLCRGCGRQFGQNFPN